MHTAPSAVEAALLMSSEDEPRASVSALRRLLKPERSAVRPISPIVSSDKRLVACAGGDCQNSV